MKRMTPFKLTFWGALFALFILNPAGPASAHIVVLDFDQGPGGATANYLENGFRVSPNYHYDILDEGVGGTKRGFNESFYIGTDGNSGWNPDFLGPAEYQATGGGVAVLWIDAGGEPFSLLDLWDPSSTTWRIESSGGGVYSDSDPTPGTVLFSGAEWQNIEWLLWRYEFLDPGIPIAGLDHMRFLVAEPATLALLGLGFAGLGWSRRKKA